MAVEVASSADVVEVLPKLESDEDDIDYGSYSRIVILGVDGSPQSELAFRSK